MTLTYTRLSFADLDGWGTDDHAAALSVFLETKSHLEASVALTECAIPPSQAGDARAYFEAEFDPVLVEDGMPCLFTGYFEPELMGSTEQSPRFPCPIYSIPPECPQSEPWLTRRQIEETGVLSGRGLEIVSLSDPVDRFFLQVQGSGRVQLPDGTMIRVGYAGKNNQPYASIGQELIRRGAIQAAGMSSEAIREWAAQHPEHVQALFWTNPSYVFFRQVTEVPPDKGPLGFLGTSVTPMRTVAIDPKCTPLGLPVWVETDGPDQLRRLMVAQDIGSAIKGPQRADIFVGTGAQAGDVAGRISCGGRMVVLFPKNSVLGTS